MIITRNQGRKLKRNLIRRNHDKEAALNLEEIALVLYESKVFTWDEAIRSVLDNPAGLDLKYYTIFSSWIKDGG